MPTVWKFSSVVLVFQAVASATAWLMGEGTSVELMLKAAATSACFWAVLTLLVSFFWDSPPVGRLQIFMCVSFSATFAATAVFAFLKEDFVGLYIVGALTLVFALLAAIANAARDVPSRLCWMIAALPLGVGTVFGGALCWYFPCRSLADQEMN